jgi:DnaJ-class molecular chaperone
MKAFLDQRSPGWRDRHKEDRSSNGSSRSGNSMTTGEAHDVLGLNLGATNDQIRAVHRRLMMKFHPDQGGSTYLATRINEAKETLLAAK